MSSPNLGAAQFCLLSGVKIHPGTSKVCPLAVNEIEQMAFPIMVPWRKWMFDRVAVSLKCTPEANPSADTIIPVPPPETGSQVCKPDITDLKTKLLSLFVWSP